MRNIQLEAARVVSSVLQSRNLTQVLAESLRQHSEFTPQQRGALQDLCYGTLRHYGKLSFMLNKLMLRPSRDAMLQHLLLVALYQLEFSKTGQHVIVDQAVRAAKHLNATAGGLVNGVLRNFQRKQESLLEAAQQHDASRYSYPQWWIDTLKQQYGETALSILEAGNQHPPMTLRVNARHSNVAEYQALLASHDIPARLRRAGCVDIGTAASGRTVAKIRGRLGFGTGCGCTICRAFTGCGRWNAGVGCMCRAGRKDGALIGNSRHRVSCG